MVRTFTGSRMTWKKMKPKSDFVPECHVFIHPLYREVALMAWQIRAESKPETLLCGDNTSKIAVANLQGGIAISKRRHIVVGSTVEDSVEIVASLTK